jgi:hypothetical protein
VGLAEFNRGIRRTFAQQHGNAIHRIYKPLRTLLLFCKFFFERTAQLCSFVSTFQHSNLQPFNCLLAAVHHSTLQLFNDLEVAPMSCPEGSTAVPAELSRPRYWEPTVRRIFWPGKWEDHLPKIERRNARRFAMKLPLHVRLENGAPSAALSTQSEDVSSRGVYFYVDKDIKSGSPIEIVMTLPHEVTLAGPVKVRCVGRVMRTETRDTRIGVVAAIERYEFLRGESEPAA